MKTETTAEAIAGMTKGLMSIAGAIEEFTALLAERLPRSNT